MIKNKLNSSMMLEMSKSIDEKDLTNLHYCIEFGILLPSSELHFSALFVRGELAETILLGGFVRLHRVCHSPISFQTHAAATFSCVPL